MHGQQNIKYK